MRRTLVRVAIGIGTLVVGVTLGSIKQHLFHKQSAAALSTVAPVNVPTPTTQQDATIEETYPEDSRLNPFEIAQFINDHPRVNLNRLWKRLNVKDDDTTPAPFRSECYGCEAHCFSYNLDDDPGLEIVLQIKQIETYRYLVFDYPAFSESKLLGQVDVWAKYPPSDPFVFLDQGRSWLVLQSTGATGSGLGAWVDTIYQVSDRGVRPVASYLGSVQQSGDEGFPSKVFVGVPISCEVKDQHAIVRVAYSVEYAAHVPHRTDPLTLFTTQKTAVLVSSLRSGETFLNTKLSGISDREWETIFNFDSMDEHDFLLFNEAQLRSIASGTEPLKKQWLNDFLSTYGSGRIKTRLLALANQSQPHN